jgi:hypothetical protein
MDRARIPRASSFGAFGCARSTRSRSTGGAPAGCIGRLEQLLRPQQGREPRHIAGALVDDEPPVRQLVEAPVDLLHREVLLGPPAHQGAARLGVDPRSSIRTRWSPSASPFFGPSARLSARSPIVSNGRRCSSGGESSLEWPASITRSRVEPERGLESTKTGPGTRSRARAGLAELAGTRRLANSSGSGDGGESSAVAAAIGSISRAR